GEVEEGPLVAVPGEDGDPVARLDAGGDQPLGDGDDVVAELRGGDVPPCAAVLAAERDGVRLLRGVGEDDVGPAALRHRGQRRDGEFTHALLLVEVATSR